MQKENGELVRCKFLFKSEKHSVEELLEHVNIPVKPNQELKCTLTPGEEFKLFISVVTKENDPSVEDLKVNPLVSDLDELNGNGSYEASGKSSLNNKILTRTLEPKT